MSQQHSTLDHNLITRYTGQPARLPAGLRRRIEELWQGEPVQLYALADLDASFTLTESWVALGPSRVAVAIPTPVDEWELIDLPRDRLTQVSEAPGLSATTLTFMSGTYAPRGGALHPPAAARLREHPVRARGGDRGADRAGGGRRPRVRRRGGAADPRGAGAGRGPADRGGLAAARLPQAVPGAGHARHDRGDDHHHREPGPALARGLRARPRGAAGARRHPHAGAGRARGLGGGGRDGAGVRDPRDRGDFPAPHPLDHRRMRRARPAHRALRAPAAALARVLLAQEDRQPDHPGHRGHRPALGLPRLRRGGRVALGGDAARA